MADDFLAFLHEHIERVERRYRALVREYPQARELRRSWTVSERALRWHVVFDGDVLEPDVDLEILEGAIVVRACHATRGVPELVCVLPIPAGFDIDHPLVRCEHEYLEIRVFRTAESERSR